MAWRDIAELGSFLFTLSSGSDQWLFFVDSVTVWLQTQLGDGWRKCYVWDDWGLLKIFRLRNGRTSIRKYLRVSLCRLPIWYLPDRMSAISIRGSQLVITNIIVKLSSLQNVLVRHQLSELILIWWLINNILSLLIFYLKCFLLSLISFHRLSNHFFFFFYVFVLLLKE